MKLDDVYNEWKDEKKNFVKESSMSSYILIYRNHLSKEFSNIDIKDIDFKTVQDLIFKLLNVVSKKSAIDIMIVFKMIMRYAMNKKYVPFIDMHIKWPSSNMSEKKELVVYSTEEQKKIIDYILKNPSPRNLGILIALATGMRIGELCGLRWSDIDLDNRILRVNRTLERIYDSESGETKIVFNDPKTLHSKRIIPLASDIMKLMKNYRRISNEDYYVISCSDQFIEPRTYRNYYRDLILKKVKLDRCIKFHGLRHTFATRLINNKIDVKTVSSILGHSDVSMTMNLYVHPNEDIKRSAINKSMNTFFKRTN